MRGTRCPRGGAVVGGAKVLVGTGPTGGRVAIGVRLRVILMVFSCDVAMLTAQEAPVGSTSVVVQPRQRLSYDLFQFPRPLVQTGRVQTGPHAQLRYGHFAAGERPAHEWCGMLALTFWAGHPPRSHTLR